MKLFIVTTAFILSRFICYGQDSLVNLNRDTLTNKIVYTGVVHVKNSSDQLFKNAQSWVTDQFKDYKKSIQVDDKANNRLILKGDIFNVVNTCNIGFTCIIDIKENRYRYQIKDIIITSYKDLLSRIPTSIRAFESEIDMYNKAKPKSSFKKYISTEINTENSLITGSIDALKNRMNVNDAF